MAENFIAVVFLGGLSIRDLRKKEISVPGLIALLFISVGVMIVRNNVYKGLLGLIPGVVLYVIAKLTREQIGKGDAFVVMGTGMLLGVMQNMELLLLALFFCALWAAGALIFGHWSKRRTLPFMPFMTAAQLVLTIMATAP